VSGRSIHEFIDKKRDFFVPILHNTAKAFIPKTNTSLFLVDNY